MESDPPITTQTGQTPHRGVPFAVQRAMTLRSLVQTHRTVWPPVEPAPVGTASVGTAPVDPTPRAPRPRRRMTVLAAAAGAVLIGVVVGVSTIHGPGTRSNRPDAAGAVAAVPTWPSATAQLDVAPTPQQTAPASVNPSPTAPVPHPSVTGPAAPPAQPKALTGEPNPAGVNLALRRPATASTVQGAAWTPAQAFDGDQGTRWSSAFADPQWLQVDLGSNRLVSEIRLVWERAYATEYRVEGSLDGSHWSTIYATSSGAGGTVTINAGSSVARYVRMYGSERVSEYGYSLPEFEVR